MTTQNEKLERVKEKLKELISLNTFPENSHSKLTEFCYKIMLDSYQVAINFIDEEIQKS